MHTTAIHKRDIFAAAPFSNFSACLKDRQGNRTFQHTEFNIDQERETLHRHAFESLCEQGPFPHTQQKGITPPLCVYWSLLKACCKTKALAHAKNLSFCLFQHPLQPIIRTPLGQYVVVVLVKCGSLEDALEIFNVLPSRSVFAWTAVISGYAACGRGQDALEVYRRMREESVEPNGHTFVSMLRSCGSEGLLQEGMRLHIEANACMFSADVFTNAALMDMYAKCGSITNVEKVFDGLPDFNAVVWTTMLFAYVESGEPKKALQLYKQMQEQVIITDERTIVGALQACGMVAEKEESIVMDGHLGKLSALETGRVIHVDAESKSFNAHLCVGNSLMIMYGKCGSIAEAENVFVGLSQRTVVSWTAMLTVYAENKEGNKVLKLFWQMQVEGVSANECTFLVVLQACCIFAEEERHVQGDSFLQIGMALHADARKLGYISDVFVENTIINMYGKFGSLMPAINVFLQLRERSPASWNSMLSAFLEQGEAGKALQLYALMQKKSVTVDGHTFVVVLKACGILADSKEAAKEGGYLIRIRSLQIGCALHDDARKEGLDEDHFVCHGLISMYGKCGSFSKARAAFDSLSKPNIVSWNVLLSAYVNTGGLAEAREADLVLETYRHNCFKNFVPTRVSFIVALQACCALARDEEPTLQQKKLQKASSLKAGQIIHSEAEMMGLVLDVTVGSSLVSMYGSCGNIKEAESIYFMQPRHEISSNAMLSAYAELEEDGKVLQLHGEMRKEGAKFYDATLVCVLHACRKGGYVELCRDIHFTAVSAGYELPVDVLVHAYGSCAATVDALAMFEMLPDPQVVAWNALSAVCSHHCDILACLKVFDEMKLTDVRPDGGSFLSALFACTHTGLVDLVVHYFICMIREYCIIPKIQHYGLILDSLGRAGDFKRAEPLLEKMPIEPDFSMWTCLLAACFKHSHVELAQIVLNCAVNLGPIEGSSCVLISNIYSM